MKPYKQVRTSRVLSHQDGASNSVHRSSLIVPELAGSAVEISFLNHFLIKRDIPHAACRITAVDTEGHKIESRLHPLKEARVYTIPLTGMVDRQVSSYLVDFYTPENLYVPFPAVMVNHHGPGYHNMVHSYNRILNDVFEDDEVNNQQVAESSIDVKLDWETDTFVVFTAGFQRCQGDLQLELDIAGELYFSSLGLDVPRFCNKEISLREVFPDAPSGAGILKLRQPDQFMFFGRMLVGRRDASGAFSANHSYYDSSCSEEYWDDDRESTRLYPYFPEHHNTIRMYPIMSPSLLDVGVRFYDRDGVILADAHLGELESPGHSFLDASAEDLIDAKGIQRSEVATFELVCRPLSGRTPTRIVHQLVQGVDKLQSSMSVALYNPNASPSGTKQGSTWGQAVVSGDVDSWLGIVGGTAQGDTNVEVVFYGGQGEITRRNWNLIKNGSLMINVGQELEAELAELPAGGATYVWYVAKGDDANLAAFVVDQHRETGHCSGEHSF